MTIKEFMEKNQALDKKFTNSDGKKLSETMAKYTSVWSNGAAEGYVIKAAEALHMSREKIEELLDTMEWAFSELTVEEAEKIYYDY